MGLSRARAVPASPINLNKTESGNKGRGNLTWHVTPDIMAYYTYSQGFRPGGFNRTSQRQWQTSRMSARLR